MVMTYEELVERVRTATKNARVSKTVGHVAFQFNVEGEAEGAFYVEISGGKIHVEPYEYYDRDAAFICTSDVLFKLISGKLDPVKAFTIGKLKVEGDLGKALKLKDFI